MTRTNLNPMGPWEVAEDFHVPEGFSDGSWENDSCPSVYHLTTEHSIYWDTETHANAIREGYYDGFLCGRFCVVSNDTYETIYNGNDLQEAIRVASVK